MSARPSPRGWVAKRLRASASATDHMAQDLFLGIDLGTGGVRACAIDGEARIVGIATTALPAPRQEGEGIDQAPDLWWNAVVETIGRLALERGAIRRISVDGTSGTLLLTDGDGVPLTPGLMYNDARAGAEATRIGAIAPTESGAHGRSSALAKLLHLLGRGADKAKHALHQADWIAGRLTGRFDGSDENNALKLGYDPVARRWPDWLDQLDVPRALLPQVRVPGAEIGVVDPRTAELLGLSPATHIHAGTTDGVAAFIATRASAPGDAVTSLGTTLVVKLLAERPVFAADQGIYSHRLGDRWLAGGASNTGGAALLAHFSAAQLEAMTPRLNPARPTGLDYYPLPKPGERFPIADPKLAPRVAPRPADDVAFFQGLLEGVAAIEAMAYRRLG